MNRKLIAFACTLLLGVTFNVAHAKVSAEEAAKLKKELTPIGAERAGNADGSIPAWNGGLKPPAGFKNGDWMPDPFAGEKPLFTITKDNYQKYADKLAVSQIEMFKRVPSFKMDVYPTHRTVEMPDWVTQNMLNNATTAELVDEGNGVTGACGGVPFPIPKSGGEAIQNYLMRYYGSNVIIENLGVSGYQNSDPAPTFGTEVFLQFPYYQKGQACGDGLLTFANTYTQPARRKGEQLIVRDYLNASAKPREAWQYIPGQRRVRRAPTIGFDTPDMAISTYDDAYMYNGSPERYDWKLVGKKEIYIPYNGYDADSGWANGLYGMKDMTHEYPTTPAIFRWELHRVWVVEGTLKQDARHIYAKRTFYLDEDSWAAGIQDRFDAKGELWRFAWGNILYYYAPEAMFTEIRPILQKDLQSGEYMLWYISLSPLRVADPQPDEYFGPSGLRKRAVR